MKDTKQSRRTNDLKFFIIIIELTPEVKVAFYKICRVSRDK